MTSKYGSLIVKGTEIKKLSTLAPEVAIIEFEQWKDQVKLET